MTFAPARSGGLPTQPCEEFRVDAESGDRATNALRGNVHFERPFSGPTRKLPTLSPDLAFQACANAAAAAYAVRPPFVTYHVVTHVSVPSLNRERDVIRSVMVRTSDDRAIIQDLPQGKNQVGHGFPLTPVFDAISSFGFNWNVTRTGELTSYVHDVVPLTFTPSQQGGADVVVSRLRYFHAEYAPDSSDAPDGTMHVTLAPYQFLVEQVPRDDLFFNDVSCSNATGLPTHVRLAGGHESELIVDYAMVEGHWLVQHVHYEQTYVGPLSLYRIHSSADAQYSEFTFPPGPPDPRLAD